MKEEKKDELNFLCFTVDEVLTLQTYYTAL